MKVDEIPNKNVREVRPCYNNMFCCIFYSSSTESGGRCLLHLYDQKLEWSFDLDRPEKCPDHFYREEMQALLNDRNMKDFLCYL